jgi:ribosomal protein S27AE
MINNEYPVELLRTCPYCGVSFIANHGLRQFCPEKYGRANYCKHQYKALLEEKKLAGVGISTQPIRQVEHDPVKNNEGILRKLLGILKVRIVSKDLLISMGYQFDKYWFKYPESWVRYSVIIGRYTLEEIEENQKIPTYKIEIL